MPEFPEHLEVFRNHEVQRFGTRCHIFRVHAIRAARVLKRTKKGRITVGILRETRCSAVSIAYWSLLLD